MSLVLSRSRIIYAGKRGITIESGGKRFKIYLPIELNDLWKELHQRKIKVNVYLEIPET